jgi:chromate transporter
LRLWLSVGLHSFGGGPTTLALIRNGVVERHGWLSEAEYTREWALCQLAPGINLLALAILIGRRVDGLRGSALSLLGLLVPSVAVTIAVTAAYAQVQRLPGVQAALRGVIPATVGLGLLTAYRTARPVVHESYLEGKATLLAALLVLAGATGAVALWHRPVVLVLLAGGMFGAAFRWAKTVWKGGGR